MTLFSSHVHSCLDPSINSFPFCFTFPLPPLSPSFALISSGHPSFTCILFLLFVGSFIALHYVTHCPSESHGLTCAGLPRYTTTPGVSIRPRAFGKVDGLVYLDNEKKHPSFYGKVGFGPLTV